MNREVHVRIWERPEVRVLRATRHFNQFPPTSLSVGYRIVQRTFGAPFPIGCRAPIPVVRGTAMELQGSDPKLSPAGRSRRTSVAVRARDPGFFYPMLKGRANARCCCDNLA